MDKNRLKQLLKQDEGPKLDFKARLSLVTESEKKELTKDVIAIANTRGGRGHIIFGVEDKTKRIIGIDPGDFKEEQIQQIIYNRCDPPVSVSVEFVDLEGKLLAVITIFTSSHRPHQMLQNGAFYVRRGSTTDVARRSEIANLFQENGLMTYETVVLHHVGIDELDMALVKQYFNSLSIVSENPGEILMEAMGFFGQKSEGDGFHPTIGGLLLFGRNPSRFLPHIYIKVVYKEKVEYFNGNILSMLNDTSAYIRNILGDGSYPYEAVEEAIANALAHRDYLDTSRGISIVISDKNIEISNPGSLIAGNSIYKYIKEANPERRNPWLYQRLLTMDTGRRFLKSGMGMIRIRKAFHGIGEVKFINIGLQNLFKVILPREVVKV